MHALSVSFSILYCIAYVVVLSQDWPLFLYYPEENAFAWGWNLLEDVGPGITWYGLMATASLIALPVSLLIPGKVLLQRLDGFLWLIVVGAMIGCVYLMRIFFMV